MHGSTWTPETDAKITRLRLVGRLEAEDIALRVGRSTSAVHARLGKLRVILHDHERWDEDRLAWLVSLVVEEGRSVGEAAALIGCGEERARTKLAGVGVRLGRVRKWTAEEDALAASVAEASVEDRRAMAVRLGRPLGGLVSRIRAMGFRRVHVWTDEETTWMRVLSADHTVEAAAGAMGLDVSSVRAKAYTCGIRFVASDGAARPWTGSEIARLRDLAGGGPPDADRVRTIAAELGRPERTVRIRLRHLGLARRRRRLDDAAREAILEVLREGVSLRDAKRRTGWDDRTLKSLAESAGLSFASVPPKTSVACTAKSRRARPRAPEGDSRRATSRPGPVRYPLPAGTPDVRIRPGPERAAQAARAARAAEARRREREKADLLSMAGEVERFLREHGATRLVEGPVDALVRAVRARGYSVTGCAGNGFLVDGRRRLDGVAALATFADERGIAHASAST